MANLLCRGRLAVPGGAVGGVEHRRPRDAGQHAARVGARDPLRHRHSGHEPILLLPLPRGVDHRRACPSKSNSTSGPPGLLFPFPSYTKTFSLPFPRCFLFITSHVRFIPSVWLLINCPRLYF